MSNIGRGDGVCRGQGLREGLESQGRGWSKGVQFYVIRRLATLTIPPAFLYGFSQGRVAFKFHTGISPSPNALIPARSFILSMLHQQASGPPRERGLSVLSDTGTVFRVDFHSVGTRRLISTTRNELSPIERHVPYRMEGGNASLNCRLQITLISSCKLCVNI